MCGIVGYIGTRRAEDVVLHGLKKLEYRGYDSAGLALVDDGKLHIAKEAGKLSNLAEAVRKEPLPGLVGIGHTRWATHGKPSVSNTHPHTGPSGRIAVVHNGIIENHMNLRETYLQGAEFKSETDSEVIAHLLDHFYEGDILEAVKKVIGLLEGAFALVVLCADEPDRLIACCKESPIVIGLGENENFVASDVPALLSYTRRCIYLESAQVAEITAETVRIMNVSGELQEAKVDDILWDEQSAEKGGYEHFMIKEIYEQPDTFQRVMSGRVSEQGVHFDEFTMTAEQIAKWNKIYIVGCGTAYHAGLTGQTILEKMLKIPVSVEVASEFRYRDPMVDENTLCIAISQSGETADTMAALREAKKKGATILSITNVVGSAISRESDMVIYLWAGPEISVASTKAYTSMLIAFYMLGLYMGDVAGSFKTSEHRDLLDALRSLPKQAEALLGNEMVDVIKKTANAIKAAEHIFYVGRGLDWPIAREAALKLKETSYIHAEAYAAGELKHGTMALITTETPVIGIALQQDLFDKTMSNLQGMHARGAQIISVVKEDQTEIDESFGEFIKIPPCPDFLAPVLSALPLQLLAYHTAYSRGCNIDQPRNLAKSVTVE